jgi:hypothetical protein
LRERERKGEREEGRERERVGEARQRERVRREGREKERLFQLLAPAFLYMVDNQTKQRGIYYSQKKK